MASTISEQCIYVLSLLTSIPHKQVYLPWFVSINTPIFFLSIYVHVTQHYAPLKNNFQRSKLTDTLTDFF